MSAAWKQDFPNLRNYYIFQIWPAACGDTSRNDQLREVQRTLPFLYSSLRPPFRRGPGRTRIRTELAHPPFPTASAWGLITLPAAFAGEGIVAPIGRHFRIGTQAGEIQSTR
jgi:hypothetical protein